VLWLPLLAKVRALQARGGRNPFVNGAMRIAQRGVTQALTTAPVIGSIDAWWALQAGAANGFLAQQTPSGLAGFSHRLRCGRNAAGAQLGVITAASVIETLDCTRFQGKVCNFNFYGIKGANFSSAANALGVSLITGTGADQGGASMIAGTWTGSAATVASSVTLTNGWVRYTFPVLIPAGATEIGAIFSFTPTGVAGADDSFYLTGVQLNEGAAAQTFDTLEDDDDLDRCLRRLPVFDAAAGTGDRWNGFGNNTTSSIFYLPFTKVARVPVTGIVVPDATKWSIYVPKTAANGAAVSATFNAGGIYTGAILFSTTAGTPTIAAGDFVVLFPNGTTGKIIFTGAEL
jgi:hypothetical protein